MNNPTPPNELSSATQKRTQLAQLLQEKASSKSFPLSSSQERLWFLDQWQPNSAAYNICRGLRLRGALDVEALQRSLSAVVARHEALRTTFSDVNGQPRQRINPPPAIALPLIDVDGDETEQQTAEQIITAEARRPFDLATGPLLRAILLRLEDEDYILLLVVHHIVADGWSMRVFFREMAGFYESYTEESNTESYAATTPVSLPALPIQYVDYAVWQQEWLQSEVSAQDLAYWQQQLAPPRPILDLPTDFPRPATRTDRGARYTFALPPALCADLKALSRVEGVTLFMSLLAAFKVLLYRYTGQTDILIGTPMANRNRQEVEGLIGFFVNTLVLRSDLSGEPTFRALLKQIRQMTATAYAHQGLPFEKLVADLQPERDPSRTPLFQVVFAFQPDPTPALNLPHIDIEALVVDNGTAKFDLLLNLQEAETGLEGYFEYNTDLFDAATIKRMAGHYHRLLAGIVAAPDTPITQLPLLTGAEQQTLAAWNATQTDYPGDTSIHRLFEAQAAQTPQVTALIFDERQLTYGELNLRANQLAHYLQAAGIRPGDLVALCLERSIEMIVGLLAILKAGAAYVPLDPAYPVERLTFMLTDTEAPLLLTHSRLIDQLPPYVGQTVCVDTDWPRIKSHKAENLTTDVAAQDLAYVIYTSGSTGKPKGVQIEHRGLVNLICWHQQIFNVTATDHASQLASLSFDAAGWEIWPYLTAGATLHLPPDEETRVSPEHLRDWLVSQQITLAFVPTPLAEKLMRLDWPGQVALRAMLTGGDKLHTYPDPDLPFALINNYGPTEYTVVTTSTTVSATPQKKHPPSIGRPIANSQVYILDTELQPVPIGVIGELHVGGPGLARGYLNRPALTAEKFIPNPFSHNPDARLYKTGDLARYLPDGHIEFLGRLDHQVKIRGFRIELGEVETTLHHHPAINQAVVVAKEERPGDQRLVAYYTAAQPLSTTELRRFLSQSLPDYMLPATFVHLERMPLTPNNKIDRQALPAPTFNQTTENHIPPSTPTEKTLAEMWTDLLNLEQVGIQDNFFEVGGHSLLATQLISRIYKRFTIDLPLMAFFQAPTIAGLIETLLAYEKTPGQIEKTAELYQKLNNMSPDQIRALLEAKKQS